MITKEILLKAISEEKDKYNKYIQLCNFYDINPSEIAEIKCNTRVEVFEFIIKNI